MRRWWAKFDAMLEMVREGKTDDEAKQAWPGPINNQVLLDTEFVTPASPDDTQWAVALRPDMYGHRTLMHACLLRLGSHGAGEHVDHLSDDLTVQIPKTLSLG